MEQTRAKQLSIWADLVKDYQTFCKSTSIDVAKVGLRCARSLITSPALTPAFCSSSQAASSKMPLVCNNDIKRALSEAEIRLVLDEVCKQGFGTWTSESKRVCLTSVKKFAEWAGAFVEWAKEQGQDNRMITLNELRTEDSSASFYNLDAVIAHEALKLLEKDGKALLYPGDSLDELGIKILPN